MKVTLLVDKQEHDRLQSEFGLAFLLETPAGDYLFDTGAATALTENLKILDIPPEKIRQVILSHGHYDHTGGLSALAPQKIFCTKNVTQSHYSYHSENDIHHISMPEAALKVLASANVTYIEKFTEIATGLYLTGPIPRYSFEDCGGKFFHDKACTIPDTVSEEQALLTADGVLISGCCHAGLINTMEYCKKIHPEISIHTVIGGLHLRSASQERLQATAEHLLKNAVKNLYILHCTGENAIDFLRTALSDSRVISPKLGESWVC